MFKFLKKKQISPVKTVEKLLEKGLGEECAVLDFDSTLTKFGNLKPKAQVTFLYRLVGILPFDIAKVLQSYVSKRLGYVTNNDERSEQRNLKRDTNLRRD